LPVSSGFDGSLSLIWNLSGSFQGPGWLPAWRKEYSCSYLCSSLLHSTLRKC